MAQIAVAAAIGAGFGLIRRRPLAVLAWGGVAAIMHALAVVLIGPMYLGLISAVFHAAQSRSGPPDFSAFAPQAAQLQGLIQLLNLANLLVGATIYCAVFRAVLHPERSTFAYLRRSTIGRRRETSWSRRVPPAVRSGAHRCPARAASRAARPRRRLLPPARRPPIPRARRPRCGSTDQSWAPRTPGAARLEVAFARSAR